jgi:hypothetical protein
MICPRCNAEFESEPTHCPECGLQLLRNVSGVMKTSTVMIASGGEQSFYRSVQDVPEPLRTKLLASTQSENSGTIVIADRAGKEQLTQIVARRESAKERRPGIDVAAPVEPAPDWLTRYLHYRFFGYSWVVWAGVLLFLAAAGLIGIVFTMHP